jgi:hypothetical protein
MRQPILLLFLTLVTIQLVAQSRSQVDSIVNRYPRAFWSPEKLSRRITEDFPSDSARARAIYIWTTKHVSYDVKKYELLKKRKYVERLVKQIRPFNAEIYSKKAALRTIRMRKGVCADYSNLYKRLAILSGLNCEVVTGFAKATRDDIGKLPRQMDHAWNAVKINDEWKLLDATWGAGYLDTEKRKFVSRFNPDFYFTLPELFAVHHFPREKKWLMTSMTDSAFSLLPLYHKLDSKIEVLEPASGILEISSRVNIEFRIKTKDDHVWSYTYRKEKRRFPIDASRNGEIVNFEIPASSFRHDYLTVYCGTTGLATFQVKSTRWIKKPLTGPRKYDLVINK